MEGGNVLTIAYLNIHGQTGLPVTKQKQIEDFIIRNRIDILHCQEIDINEESFSQCYYLAANYNILKNNALNKYGTATFVKNIFTAENIRTDILGRSIFFNIEDLTLGNGLFTVRD